MLGAACVPISRTVTLSPNVIGTLQRADGTPFEGERLALSIDGNSTCVTPASFTITDAGGNFEFAAVRKREQFIILLFDRVLCYNVCGREAINFTHQFCFLHRVPTTDHIACVEFTDQFGEGASHVRCNFRPRRRS